MREQDDFVGDNWDTDVLSAQRDRTFTVWSSEGGGEMLEDKGIWRVNSLDEVLQVLEN